MAYNTNLYQYGYNQPNMMYQPNAMQPVNGLISVTGVEGAKAYPLPPNSRMPLFDQNEDILYILSSDGAGFKTVTEFDFTPRAKASENQPAQVDYVPRPEFDALVAKVNELSQPKTTRTRKAANDGE